MGARSNPCRQPFSFTSMNDRLSPIVPANKNATHSTPGPTSLALMRLRLIEKMKIMTTRSAKINIELNNSRVFISVIKSFQIIVVTWLKYFFIEIAKLPTYTSLLYGFCVKVFKVSLFYTINRLEKRKFSSVLYCHPVAHFKAAGNIMRCHKNGSFFRV